MKGRGEPHQTGRGLDGLVGAHAEGTPARTTGGRLTGHRVRRGRRGEVVAQEGPYGVEDAEQPVPLLPRAVDPGPAAVPPLQEVPAGLEHRAVPGLDEVLDRRLEELEDLLAAPHPLLLPPPRPVHPP